MTRTPTDTQADRNRQTQTDTQGGKQIYKQTQSCKYLVSSLVTIDQNVLQNVLHTVAADG